MQSLISANQKSITETKMVESSNGYVPFYANEPSLPELGIQYQKISPYITAAVPHGNSITFKLPAGAGFLYEASLGFECPQVLVVAYEAPNAPIGINMIRSIEWLSNGQPIVYKTGSAIWAQVVTWQNSAYQQHVLRYAKMLVPGTEEVVAANRANFLTYCPLHESFLTQIEKALLLNKIADLQLRVTFNTAAESGLAVAITAFTPTLYVQSYQPKLSVMQEMLTNDWSKKLVMQAINTYTEVTPVNTAAANTTSTTYTLTVPFLAFKTHVFIRGVVAAPGLQEHRIQTITMNLNGTTFLDAMPTSRMNACASKYGKSTNSVIAANAISYGSEVVTIDWGVLCGRGQNSGTAFMQELQGTNIRVTFAQIDAADVANFRLYVVHETFQTIAYEPSTGGGVLMIDSNN